MKQPLSFSKRTRRILIVIATMLALFICACIIAKIGYDIAFQRAGPPPEQATASSGSVHPRRTVEFPSGKNHLRGYVYGEDNSKGLVIISHGLGSSSEGYFLETLFFIEHGWQVLAYDNTGSHISDGKNTRGISQSLLDLDAALGYAALDKKLCNLPIVLYGHSWGGYAVTSILNWHPEIKAVVSVAGFATPKEALYDYAEGKTGIFGIIGFPFFWGYHNLLFGENANISAIDGINSSGVPTMIIHGSADQTLRYDRCSIISHEEQITNPNVEYVTRNVEGQNGHSNLMFSLSSTAFSALDIALFEKINQFYDAAL